MSLPAPITIAQEAKLIKDSLTDYVTSLGGVVEIVSNNRDFWRMDATDSQTPLVRICYNGEKARGTFSQIAPWHRVDRGWQIAVIKGRGFFPERGASLYDNTIQEVPLFDVLESIRDAIRFNVNITEEPLVDYRDIKPMTMGNLVIDGFIVNFTTANDIPFPTQ